MHAWQGRELPMIFKRCIPIKTTCPAASFIGESFRAGTRTWLCMRAMRLMLRGGSYCNVNMQPCCLIEPASRSRSALVFAYGAGVLQQEGEVTIETRKAKTFSCGKRQALDNAVSASA